MKLPLISLIPLIAVGCAAGPPQAMPGAAPPSNGATAATLIDLSRSGSMPLGTVAVDVDGTLPAQASTDAKLAGRISLNPAEPVRYSVDYALSAGDVLAHPTQDALNAGLTRIATQSFGQNLELQTPTVVGAPVSIRLRTQTLDDWTISSASHVQQDAAELSWAPRSATLRLQWLDAGQAPDPSLALGCDVLGSLQLPAGGSNPQSTRALNLSGNYCNVLTDDSRYTALNARTWRVARVWRSEARESKVALSMIDPVWRDSNAGSPDIAPSYQLGLQMRQTYGAWIAAAGASVRDPGTWAAADLVDRSGNQSAFDLTYATDATLTRRFGDALISTTWGRGANPLWFLPEGSGDTNRLNVSLDFSRWAQDFLPYMAPRLGVSWDRWQTQSAGGTLTGDRALMLQFSMTL
jgi:hypothetical protein